MALNLPAEQSTDQQFYDSIVGKQYDINPETYNKVYNFFRTRTVSIIAAQELTKYLIIMCHNNKLSVDNILPNLANNNINDVKSLVLTFFNTIREPTSKLGFNNSQNVNYWVDRNIIA